MPVIHSALIGLKDLHYAIMNEDETYAAPVKMAPVINAKVTPSVNTETLYADDGPAETAVAMGEIQVELETADLPLEVQAALLGHTLDAATGVMTKKSTDTAPYIALGFKSQKANGKYRFVWLLKGKCAPQEEEYATKEDQISYNTPKIKASFVKRNTDDVWQYVADEDSGFDGAATWFTTVYKPV